MTTTSPNNETPSAAVCCPKSTCRVSPSSYEYAYLLIGLFLVFQYEWLVDDAFVYFRYIDNWIFLKIGLVYNQGEYSEGYSSILWLLILSGLRLFNLNWWAITKLLGALCFIAFWFAGLLLQRRIFASACSAKDASTSVSKPAYLNLPLALLCTNYGVLCYFTSGLETPLVQVYALLFCLFVLSPQSRCLQVLLCFAPVLRHELVLPLGVVMLWGWWRTKQFPLVMTLITGALLGALAVFRVYYYADLLPNTFYLKDLMDIEQGLYYVHETFSTYWMYFLLPLAGVGALVLRTKDAAGNIFSAQQLRLAERGVLVFCAALIIAYVIKIGGDPRHYRYLAFPLCLLVGACSGIGELWLPRSRLGKYRVAAPVLVLLLAGSSFLAYPPQLNRHPFTYSEKHRTVHKINDASAHRRKLDLTFVTWTRELPLDRLRKLGRKKPFVYKGIKSYYRCIRAYRDIDKRFIHSLGLTEPILGRTVMKANRPAHKWGLLPLAKDIEKVQRANKVHAPGMYRDALTRGIGAPWMEKNLETIEVIERKIYNKHYFFENLKLALKFPAPIVP